VDNSQIIVQLKKLKNTELVELCAQTPDNRNAWLEFYHRFDEWIWLVIARECKAKAISRVDFQYQKTIPDLVQDVYVKLVSNECKALKNFVGASENSIYKYLNIIAKNVVKNHLTKIRAQKRPFIKKSIDEVVIVGENDERISIKEGIRSTDFDVEEEVAVEILQDEIEAILDRILKGKDKQRNKLMFKLHLFEGFSAEEIASQFPFGLTSKRVSNLIADIRRSLRQELLEQRLELF